MKELKNDIKNKNFKNIYIFYGEEEYLKSYYKENLIKSILDEQSKMMNFSSFDGNKVSSDKIIEAFVTLPFMSPHRVILVNDSELFQRGRKSDSDIMADNLENTPDTTIIIFVETKIDKRSKIYKAANKSGRVVEFKTPRENELITWTRNSCKKYGKNIDTKTTIFFIRYVNHSMEALSKEIEKLVDYKKDETDIQIDDIEKICTKALETFVFDLVNAVGNKDIKTALNIYNNLLLMKESPIMILNLLARQFRIVVQTRKLKEDGLSNNEISSAVKIRAFTVPEYLNQSRNFNSKTLLNALKDCLKCDIDIKTGKINDKLAVEMLIIKYSGEFVLDRN